MASSVVVLLLVSFLGFSATLDVVVWSNRRIIIENSRSDWSENSEGLLNRVDTASKVVLIVAEDKGCPCLTELMTGDDLVLHNAPENIEDNLLEFVRNRDGFEQTYEVFAEDLKRDGEVMTSSVVILHVNADYIQTTKRLIGDLKQSEDEVVILATMAAIINDKTNNETLKSRHLLSSSNLDDADNKTEPIHNKVVISKEGLYANHSFILLYASRLTISLNNNSFNCCNQMEKQSSEAVVLHDVHVFNTSSDYIEYGIMINISDAFLTSESSSIPVANAFLTIYVSVHYSFWSVESMELNGTINDSSTCFLLKATNRTDTAYKRNIKGVPIDTAFKCTPEIVYSNVSHPCRSKQPYSESITVNVTFTDLQFNPFLPHNGTHFTDLIDDCVGYFTPGIWAGVITSLLLIVILYIAIYVMLGMQVMDKFDDPKGKTINIQS